MFQCASGVYIIGTERGFSRDNNIVVTRMADDVGAEWTVPKEGLALVPTLLFCSQNTSWSKHQLTTASMAASIDDSQY